MQDMEKLAPATLLHLKAIQEFVQDYFGYAPGEVSPRDAAIVRWAAGRSVAQHG